MDDRYTVAARRGGASELMVSGAEASQQTDMQRRPPDQSKHTADINSKHHDRVS